MGSTKANKYIRIEGTRAGLVVQFTDTSIFAVDTIQGIGRELLAAADLAVQIDMPLIVSFQGVEDMSSALIGKLVLVNRKLKQHEVKLHLRDMSPSLEAMIRRTGPGGMGARS